MWSLCSVLVAGVWLAIVLEPANSNSGDGNETVTEPGSESTVAQLNLPSKENETISTTTILPNVSSHDKAPNGKSDDVENVLNTTATAVSEAGVPNSTLITTTDNTTGGNPAPGRSQSTAHSSPKNADTTGSGTTGKAAISASSETTKPHNSTAERNRAENEVNKRSVASESNSASSNPELASTTFSSLLTSSQSPVDHLSETGSQKNAPYTSYGAGHSNVSLPNVGENNASVQVTPVRGDTAVVTTSPATTTTTSGTAATQTKPSPIITAIRPGSAKSNESTHKEKLNNTAIERQSKARDETSVTNCGHQNQTTGSKKCVSKTVSPATTALRPTALPTQPAASTQRNRQQKSLPSDTNKTTQTWRIRLASGEEILVDQVQQKRGKWLGRLLNGTWAEINPTEEFTRHFEAVMKKEADNAAMQKEADMEKDGWWWQRGSFRNVTWQHIVMLTVASFIVVFAAFLIL